MIDVPQSLSCTSYSTSLGLGVRRVTVAPVYHCKTSPSTRQRHSIPFPTKTKSLSTHDVVPELAVAIVDLDVARLGGVRDAGDVDGLLAGRDRVGDRLGLGRGRRGRGLDATTNAEPVEVEADVCARGDALRDFGRASEGDGDVFGGTAAAGSCM